MRWKHSWSMVSVLLFPNQMFDQYDRYWIRSSTHAWLKWQWSVKYDVSLNWPSTRNSIGCVNLLSPIGQVCDSALESYAMTKKLFCDWPIQWVSLLWFDTNRETREKVLASFWYRLFNYLGHQVLSLLVGTP